MCSLNLLYIYLRFTSQSFRRSETNPRKPFYFVKDFEEKTMFRSNPYEIMPGVRECDQLLKIQSMDRLAVDINLSI